LERLVEQQLVDAGAAIALTNSDAIWRPSASGRTTGCDSFRIHNGATLTGALDWGPSAGVA
jgi:hypothetical protein